MLLSVALFTQRLPHGSVSSRDRRNAPLNVNAIDDLHCRSSPHQDRGIFTAAHL